MKPVLKVLLKLIVAQFYKINGGFFLFWFIFLFGIIPPQYLIQYHYSLIQAQITSLDMTAISSILWLFYAAKCVLAAEKIIERYQSSFLHLLQQLTSKKLLTSLGIVHFLIFFPVSAYIILLVIIALLQGHYIQSGYFLFFVIGVTVVNIIRIKNTLLNSHKAQKQNFYFLSKLIPSQKTINLNFFLLLYILEKRKINFLLLKTLTFGAFYLFFTDFYVNLDEGYFISVLLLAGYINSVLIFYIHKHHEEKLNFLRNLPISLTRRFLVFIITSICLFLPELVVMLVNGSDVIPITEIFKYYFLLVAQFILYLTLLYIPGVSTNMRKYMQYLFIVFTISVYLFILFNHWLNILFYVGLGWYIFQAYYLKYEHIATVSKE
ncbi:hypothetical protein [Chondrinema litorale]|uniref:hypothetical protein n=1 Tax=Chondrinema litorale TaxID=2994555 RepID=UPI0025433E8F|nr:hypothetical protein [Chondrinema litorale]UZR95768.1 hypothetical protein OQ292_08075 [Chondrinema litorale]